MTLEMTLAFSAAFVILAVSPGPALVATLSRTLGGGYASGLAVTSGLVLGDAVFLAIAMIGLSAIATAMGPLFQIIKYASAVYLIWMGVKTLRAASANLSIKAADSRGLVRDLGLGLVVYLSNPKPILFYGALLPTFLDLSHISALDFGVLMAVVAVVSFGVYGTYMIIAHRAGRLLVSRNTARRLDQIMGVMLLCAGLLVAST
jgi:threonine/homoserine/homoserine lactone efflux protein